MTSFRIAVAKWGVFVDINPPLTNNDRAAFIEQLKIACGRVSDQEDRSVLLDLRRVDVVGDPSERVNAYVGIARIIGARRIAVVVSSEPAASRLSEALDTAGLLNPSRILVVALGEPHPLASALRWVDEGVDPYGAPSDSSQKPEFAP